MAATRGQHLIGKVLGSCVLKRLLGYGGSSAVYLAEQQEPQRTVAVKVFLPRTNMNARLRREFYHRFLREAEAASQLNHPHILPIYAYGEQDGLPYIVMPYMEGGTLSEYLADNGALSLEETQWYLEQLASALDYAHAHGCVHCDVKLANILLDSEGHALLSDFGIAHLIQAARDPDATIPKEPAPLMGTPDYISPEQALGLELDGRSDVYSLGITIFYLLARRPPFSADTTIALALMHIHEAPPSLALIRADVTPHIDGVVRKALAKEPENRYQTAGQFCRAFIAAVEASGRATDGLSLALDDTAKRGNKKGAQREALLVAEAPVVSIKPVPAPTKRRRLLITAMVALLLLALLGSIAGYFAGNASGVGKHTPLLTPTASLVANVDRLSTRNAWPLSRTFFYKQESYHILNTSPQNVALALYNGEPFSDFHLNVTMTKVRGTRDHADYYGVVFRAAPDQSQYYLFEIVAANGGQYSFSRYDGTWHTLAAGSAPSLRLKPGKSNTVTVEATGNTFIFRINNKQVGGPIHDDHPLPTGHIGLYVEAQGSEVAFSRLYVEPRM